MRSSFLGLVLVTACGPALSPTLSSSSERSGGEATVFDEGSGAYSHPLAALERDAERQFYRGKAFFEDPWVAAPASTESRDGLGPLFNARACIDCHPRLGRGRPPVGSEATFSLLFRASEMSADGSARPHPIYGDQIQPFGIDGVDGEGSVFVTYHAVLGAFDDGAPVELRAPVYDFSRLAYGAPGDGFAYSPRVASVLVGGGFLEAIDDAAILALADPDDADGDGISGRARIVEYAGTEALGRFGWKGSAASLDQLVAGAFVEDLGLTSSTQPHETCTPSQTDCAAAPTGGAPELTDAIVATTAAFLRMLAVPARRDWAVPVVLRGEELFEELACSACHTPEHRTGYVEGLPQLSDQIIRPYTDLLLHDMGHGLADGRPEGTASGSEWRTPPLWGLGLSGVVSGYDNFLHDGRARTLDEAILWHGGEAQASRDAFLALPHSERRHLTTFLESL